MPQHGSFYSFTDADNGMLQNIEESCQKAGCQVIANSRTQRNLKADGLAKIGAGQQDMGL